MSNFYNLEYCLDNLEGGSMNDKMLVNAITDKNIDHQKLMISTLKDSFLMNEKDFNRECIITTIAINN